MAASDVFDEYFKRADLDRDGKISGAEAVAFFQGSNLPKNVLAQVWMHADQSKSGFLGRQEFYNALKLVTVAQSGRQLTPEIVKSALYGPAAAKIPAPKINPVSSPMPPINTATTPTIPTNSLRPSSNQFGSVGPNAPQNVGFRPTQAPQNTAIKQQFLPTENINLARPPQGTPTAAFPQMQGGNLGLTGGNTVAGPGLQSPINANPSSDWLGGMPSGTSVGGTSQAPVRGNTPQSKDGLLLSFSGTTGIPSRPQTQSALTSSVVPKTLDPNFASSKPSESKALGVSGYDFSSDSFYGGGGFPATSQANSGTNVLNFSANSMVNSSSIVPAPVGTQSANRSSQLDPTQIPRSFPPVNQLQQTQTSVKQNQFDNLKTSPSLTAPNGTAELANSVAAQTPVQWPKITQADIKKYTNVFVNVDKDRDGKITGDQARNLFLSWKLPREVLKQVWDLSDQDSDSMLSLREFCIALYLMERYREGRPLPSVLPSTVMYDETLMRATGMPSAAYATPNWQPGLPQGLPGPHPVMQATGIRVPMPNSIPRQAFSERHLAQQNLLKPGLSSQTAKNAGKDAQSTVNTDQEASNVDSKVQRAENKILDSKEKIEFYRTKMQELVLYKSRCDNRLNEITERASADKREVELLAKKYEEKYRQVGELASKLAIEEAKFRDIQERKMEMQNAIINIEQGGTADGLLQVRVDRIQSDLESLEKILNDRCKQLNAHVKATTSIELPFGWEPGPLEGAANWDEDWDKFEDEGFTVTKDLTSGNVNIVVNGDPPDSPSIWSDKASTEGASPIASSFNVDGKNEKLYDIHEHMNGSAYDEEESTRSPTASPGRSPLESPFNSTQFGVNEISSHTKESHSYHVDAESTVSGDKYNDEPWTFDDNDSVWKETDYESNPRDSFFTSDFGSIKADSPSASSVFGKEKKSSFFDDSVPSSPMFNTASSTIFSDGRDDYNFSSFGRFDSFATQDSAFPARESFSRFDSISSSRPETFTRFDSISSNKDFGQRRGFESFDDADPFGSTGPFKSSGGHSPRQGSDNWRAF